MFNTLFTIIAILIPFLSAQAQSPLSHDTKHACESLQRSPSSPQLPAIRTARDHSGQLRALLSAILIASPNDACEGLSTDQRGPVSVASKKASQKESPVDIVLKYIHEFTLRSFVMPSKEYDSLAVSRNGKTVAMGNSSKGLVAVRTMDDADNSAIKPFNVDIHKCLAVSDDGYSQVFITSDHALEIAMGEKAQIIKRFEVVISRSEYDEYYRYKARIMDDAKHCVLQRIEYYENKGRREGYRTVLKFNMFTRFVTDIHDRRRNHESFTFFEKDEKVIKVDLEGGSVVLSDNKEIGRFRSSITRDDSDTQCVGLAITSDGKKLIERRATGALIIRDLENKKEIYRIGDLRANRWYGAQDILFSNDLELSADGSLLAIRTNQNARELKLYRTIELFKVETHETQQLITTPEDIDSMVFSVDAQTLVVTLVDGTICVYTFGACPSDDTLEKELHEQIAERKRQQELEKEKIKEEELLRQQKEREEQEARRKREEAVSRVCAEALAKRQQEAERIERLEVENRSLHQIAAELSWREYNRQSCCEKLGCTIA